MNDPVQNPERESLNLDRKKRRRLLHRLLLPLSFFMLIPFVTEAQNTIIRGTVTDAGTGDPLAGVTIRVKGTTTGTVTDGSGNFNIEAGDDAILEVSFVGYSSKEVPVAEKTIVNVSLEASATGLDQLVVVGYGTQKKVTMTGSVSTVSMASLEQAPVVNFSNAFAGKLPGVITMNTSGQPGADGSQILIRGNHSLNNNAPLVVIDGVPNRGGGMGNLDPNEIENISVLKDATASIYGSQAANGVILITTKRGRLNQAPKFNISFDQGFTQPARIPKMADAPTYMEMLNEINLYDGAPLPYSQQDIDAYTDPARNPWLYPNTDWFREAFKPLSSQTKVNVSVEGGSSRFTYFLSMGARTQEGYFKNSGYRYSQYNLRSNVGGQITDNIKLSLDISARKEDRNLPTVSTSNTFWMLIRARPVDPAYFPNGLPGPDQENGWQPVVSATPATGKVDDQRTYLTGDLTLDITIPGLEGFHVRGQASYNKEFQQIVNWQTPWTLYSFDKNTYINNGETDPEKYLTPNRVGPTDPSLNQTFYQQHKALGNVTLNYDKDFGEHHLTVMLGTEAQQFRDNTFNAFRRHFISTAIPQLFAGGQADWSNNGSAAHGARLSYFGRATYNYKSRYLFEAIGRYDGSYLFPSENRFGFFPSVSAGWRLSEEPFFKEKTDFFDELKIRASWGKTGNDITDPDALVEAQQYLSGFSFGGNYVLGIDQVVNSIQSSREANPSITWERANMTDVGIDGVIFQNRLSFTLDYWNQLRRGILIQRNASVPQTAGLILPRENLGKVKSMGADGNLTWNQDINDDLSVQIGVNAGYSTTKIIFWDEAPGAPDYQRSTGSKINTGLYYKVLGVFQDENEVENTVHWPGARSGDLIFADVNGDGKIDGLDQIRINKNNTPTFSGGISLGVNLRHWSVSALFQGAAGAVEYVSLTSGTIGNYFEEFAQKRWMPDPGDPTGMSPDKSGAPFEGPRTYNRDQQYWSPTSNNNTYFLRETDYLRLKTLMIAYSFSDRLLSGLAGIKSLKVYLSGYNLFTWDKFKLMDPETQSGDGRFYPQSRVFNVGFNLSF